LVKKKIKPEYWTLDDFLKGHSKLTIKSNPSETELVKRTFQGLTWGWGCPAFGNRPNVMNNFSMASPGLQDGLCGSNTSASWVASWPEPMVLRGTGSPGTDTTVACTIHSISENVIQKSHIIRNLLF
jgi:hypothetical protein